MLISQPHHRPSSRRQCRRSGVSLLEVMISIGVAFMGLLGVVALLPLASHLMSRGVRADNVAALGRSSISDIDIRGVLRRDNLAVWNRNVNPPQFVPFNCNPSITAAPLLFQIPALGEGASFCVDPLLISRLYEDNVTIGSPDAPEYFPFVGIPASEQMTEARMARVTIRSMPGAAMNATQFVIPAAQADNLFRIKDDLVFKLPGRAPDLPDDDTLPPVQEFSQGTTGAQKRQYKGTLSWMATFSPVVAQTGGGALQDLYTMSIVVFDGRVLDLSSEPERVADVAWFWGGGIGGGDLQITPHQAAARPETDLDMEGVAWVMLSGRLPPDQASNTPGASVFRWYRVLSAEGESTLGQPADPNYSGPNIWLRDISLYGADWNPALFVKTQVTIVSGVVAVFEKTVRLENSSLWTASY